MKLRISGIVLLIVTILIVRGETYILTNPLEYPIRTGLAICYLVASIAMILQLKWFWVWGLFSFTIWGHSLLLQVINELIALPTSLETVDKPKVAYVALGMVAFFTAIYFTICLFVLHNLWKKEIRIKYPVNNLSRHIVSILSLIYAISFAIYSTNYALGFINMMLFLVFGVYLYKPSILKPLNYLIYQ